ncbi:hypothetical protein BH09CHL1_BH09CHL1_02260 [soil metagenome]
MSKRCAETGCGRFVRRGEEFCARHWDGDGSVGRAPPIDERDPAALFQERLAQGNYRSLLDPEVWDAIDSAGAERGLSNEIGLLRVVLVRLLSEEPDASRLAQGVARVTGVLVQAARAQRAISGESAEGLAEAVTQILMEFGGEL